MIGVRTFLKNKFHFALGMAVLLLASNASAFRLDGNHWTYNRTVRMYLSLGGSVLLQDGFSSFDQSAADALNIWNNHLVHMKFASELGSPLPAVDGDSDNSVIFSDTVYGTSFGSSTVAVTLLSSRDGVFTEGDVLFNKRRTWDSYRGPQQGNVLDFHRVALHEFGHVLGLDHPDEGGQNVVAIMNSLVGNIDALRQDDISGGQAIYNTGPAYLSTNPSPHLINLSTRALVGTGERVLIGGLVIQGSQPATVVLRAIGHSLAARGLPNALADPQIELRNVNGALVAQNDDWIGDPNAETIASYRLDPPNSFESALLRTLSAGNYTAIVRAFDNGDGKLTGNGLVELFDLHTSEGRAGNISARGQVLTGDNVMIAGFVIGSGQAKEVVVRGIGPSLSGLGVANALANPTLELRNSAGSLLLFNDDWESDPNADKVISAGLKPTRTEEAAFYANLSAGAYTAIMRGANNTTGVGLVEVYDLAPPPN